LDYESKSSVLLGRRHRRCSPTSAPRWSRSNHRAATRVEAGPSRSVWTSGSSTHSHSGRNLGQPGPQLVRL